MIDLSCRRRRHGLAALALLLLLPLGCGTTHMVAPPGRTVRMLGEDEPAAIHTQRTVWFWMWGVRPISDNTTQQDIEQYDLREVRYTTYQTCSRCSPIR